MKPLTSTSLSRPGAWKNDVLNVRRPWRMSCRWAPAAHAAAAAASALATFMRARPPNVAGMRCVYSSGSVRVGVAQHHQLAVVGGLQDHRRAAAAAVAVDAVVALLPLLGLHREVDDVAAALARHPGDQRIVGVEHGRAGARHGLDEHGLDGGQLADRVDAVQAQVVAGDVGHDGDVVAVVAQALAQDAAARDLEHARVDRRVLEHHPRRARARSCRPS